MSTNNISLQEAISMLDDFFSKSVLTGDEVTYECYTCGELFVHQGTIEGRAFCSAECTGDHAPSSGNMVTYSSVCASCTATAETSFNLDYVEVPAESERKCNHCFAAVTWVLEATPF